MYESGRKQLGEIGTHNVPRSMFNRLPKLKRSLIRIDREEEAHPNNSVQLGHRDLLRPLYGIGHLLLMLQAMLSLSRRCHSRS